MCRVSCIDVTVFVWGSGQLTGQGPMGAFMTLALFAAVPSGGAIGIRGRYRFTSSARFESATQLHQAPADHNDIRVERRLRSMLIATVASMQVLTSSTTPAEAMAASASDDGGVSTFLVAATRSPLLRSELNKLVDGGGGGQGASSASFTTKLPFEVRSADSLQQALDDGLESLRQQEAMLSAPTITPTFQPITVSDQFKIKPEVQAAVRNGFAEVVNAAQAAAQAIASGDISGATTGNDAGDAVKFGLGTVIGKLGDAAASTSKLIKVEVPDDVKVSMLSGVDTVVRDASELSAAVGRQASSVGNMVQSASSSIQATAQATQSALESQVLPPISSIASTIDAVKSKLASVQPRIDGAVDALKVQWTSLANIPTSEFLEGAGKELVKAADNSGRIGWSIIQEQVGKLPPISFPTNMQMLSTTVRPTSPSPSRQYLPVEEWASIVHVVDDLTNAVKQGALQVGVSVGEEATVLQDAAASTATELSKLRPPTSEDIKTFVTSIDWRTCAGLLGLLVVADALQKGAFLSSVVDSQAIQLEEKIRQLSKVGEDNEVVANLRLESEALLKDVDTLIAQLAQKSAEVDSLSETIQTLSKASNAEAKRADSLDEELSKLRRDLSSALQEMAIAATTAPSAPTVAPVVVTQVVEKADPRTLAELEALAQWQRRMSAAVRNAMAAQGRAVPTRELPEVFGSWLSARVATASVGQAAELQALSEVTSVKMETLERRAATAEAAVAEIKAQSALEIQAFEKSLAAEKATNKELTLKANSLTESTRAAATQMKTFGDDMMAKFSAMEVRIESLAKENADLTAKVQAMEKAAAALQAATATAKSAPNSTAEIAAAQQIINQLTAQNDDLKQRLLSSDERFFDLQQDMQSKLDSAKDIAKQLESKLTARNVEQESKEGRLMQQVKELEEAGASTQKMLIETQQRLDTVAASATDVADVQLKAVPENALMKRVRKGVEKAMAKTSAPAPSRESDDAPTTTEATAPPPLKALTSSQMKKKTKKDLEAILSSLGVTMDPVSGKKIAELGKPVLLSLVETELELL